MNNALFLCAVAGRLAIVAFFVTFSFLSVQAATFTVTKIADTADGSCDADCSLREAISAANSTTADDVIEFDAAVFGSAQTITLNGTPLEISGEGVLVINGTGADLLAVSGNNLSRVLNVNQGATAFINRLTIRDGNGQGNTFNRGGGILNSGNLNLDEVVVSHNRIKKLSDKELTAGGGIFSTGTMKIVNSRIEFNTAERDLENSELVNGGGIFNWIGEMSIINSSVTDNSAQGNGGGINNNSFATLTITNSTVSHNSALLSGTGVGGGICNFSIVTANHLTVANNTSAGSSAGVLSDTKDAVFYSQNSIYARNMGGPGIRDFRGAFTSQGFNLIENTTFTVFFGDETGNITGQNPQLLSLANNGGFAKSLALATGSPAIDRGKSFGVTTDQRGSVRPFDNPAIPNAPGGDGADIGAFELNPDTPDAAVFDFDGDGKTDVGIFRPSVGEWWISRSSSNQVFAVQFGSSTDKIVPADFTGDGKADVAFWRESTGEWFILRSEDNSFYAFPFGTLGDIPAPGDFDADGRADAAVFRPSNATWYILRSSDGGVVSQQFGISEDLPVVSDYDGDGKDDIGIFRPSVSEWWILRSTAGLTAVQFGSPGDKTVSGDYTGDGKADIAFWRPATGEWFILRSENNSFYAFPFGTMGDVPAPGDYDRDGRADAAVFRPSNSVWYLQRSSSGFEAVPFGTTGDQPIPNAFVR